jgi:hypothetical protein
MPSLKIVGARCGFAKYGAGLPCSFAGQLDPSWATLRRKIRGSSTDGRELSCFGAWYLTATAKLASGCVFYLLSVRHMTDDQHRQEGDYAEERCYPAEVHNGTVRDDHRPNCCSCGAA